MPTYEYLCNTCGHRFEKFQKFSEDPIKDCPNCGKEVRKVFHASGVVFKGSGWYINDSRNSGSTTKSSSDTSSDKVEAGVTEAKSTEAKAETKTEPKAETKAAPTSEPKAESKSKKGSEAA